MLAPTHVTAFVDWDTARRINRPDGKLGQISRHSRDLAALQEALARVLDENEPRTAFRVALRLYHGWYTGKTQTEDHRRMKELRSTSRTIGWVSFAHDVVLSTDLLCRGRRSTLYDTLRFRPQVEQKMVDTALVSDLLHFARTAGHRGQHRALVVGDDDDLLPGIFTAIEWGANVKLVRLRLNDNPHLDTSDLVYRMEPCTT